MYIDKELTDKEIILNIYAFICNWALKYRAKTEKYGRKRWPTLQVKDFNIPLSLDERYAKIQKNKITLNYQHKKLLKLGLPWWHSGWESAFQCRGHGFEPWSGKIPHAAERLGPWPTIAELARLEPVLHKRGHDSERPAHRDEEWPPLAATRESPRTETKTQHSHK